MESRFVMSKFSDNCIFCKNLVWKSSGHFVVQGRGKFKCYKYFHDDCLKKAVKDGTYWNFKE